MSPANTAHLLADLTARIAEADPERRGALWSLTEPARQLDANLIRLPAGAFVDEHREEDLDVLLLILAGTGVLLDDARSVPLTAGALVWLPRTARRGLRAGPGGLAYLTAHRRRAGLAVRGTERAVPAEAEGGESACWLHELCPACGSVPDGVAPAFCSRCGERLPGN
ncbi:cupin domain-containing protein [Streptomyces sp. SBT349]|uniref:cupin domain-containing protein n=1 Tax=Streptomyces sp. SBT349 TaxID=1580539 RepID=UPI00066D09DB|nr:cupin domain-containing protein [Streptomyces sp. SBT349]